MSNAQELYQVANDLDKDELVSLLVEAQMKNEQLATLEKINEGQMKMVKMLKEKWNEEQMKNKKLKEEIFLTNMKLVSANENADVERHNEAAGIILAENQKLKEENATLKQKLEDETCWEEFQEVMDKLKEQNKKLKEDITTHPDFAAIATDWYERHNWLVDVDEYNELKEYCDKWSPILSDIDGDDFCNLLCEYGWVYNEENELVRSED